VSDDFIHVSQTVPPGASIRCRYGPRDRAGPRSSKWVELRRAGRIPIHQAMEHRSSVEARDADPNEFGAHSWRARAHARPSSSRLRSADLRRTIDRLRCVTWLKPGVGSENEPRLSATSTRALRSRWQARSRDKPVPFDSRAKTRLTP